jgi:hypothetical protein
VLGHQPVDRRPSQAGHPYHNGHPDKERSLGFGDRVLDIGRALRHLGLRNGNGKTTVGVETAPEVDDFEAESIAAGRAIWSKRGQTQGLRPT